MLRDWIVSEHIGGPRGLDDRHAPEVVGRLSGEKLVEHHPERVHVTPRVDRLVPRRAIPAHYPCEDCFRLTYSSSPQRLLTRTSLPVLERWPPVCIVPSSCDGMTVLPSSVADTERVVHSWSTLIDYAWSTRSGVIAFTPIWHTIVSRRCKPAAATVC